MDSKNAAKMYRNMLLLCGTLLLSSTLRIDAQEIVCRSRPMDIIFVLDGSRSVRRWHFKSTKDAVKDMVDQFESIGPETTQIGLIQYASVVKEEFALGQYQSKQEVNEAIDSITYMAKGTMTGAALKYLVTRAFTKPHGARMDPEVARVAVIITDGRAQDSRAVEVWHNKVKEAGIEVFTIGVGRHIDDEDLIMMASDPKETHKFHVRKFNLIQSLQVTLQEKICVTEINECETGDNNCEQVCQNTIGSFECLCLDGFQLQDDGFSCWSVLPASPVRLTVTNSTHTSFQVSWDLDKPEKASKAEYYTLMYQPADGSDQTAEIRVTEPEAVLEGLDPNTKYNISVKSHGNGHESEPLTGTATTLSLGATAVTVSNPTLTTLHAEWRPAGGDLLTGYSLKVLEIAATIGKKDKMIEHASVELASDIHDMNIDGLKPGTKYKVEVTPKHGELTGVSDSDTETTLALSPPDVAIPMATFTTAEVEWSNIGVQADNFTVRLIGNNSIDGEDEKVIKTAGHIHSAKFTGLKPGRAYLAIVIGSISEGGMLFVSPEGTSEGTTMDLAAPNVTVQKTTFTTAIVNWSGVGTKAEKFKVHLTRADGLDGKNGRVLMTKGDEHSANFTHLTPGTTYSVTVTGFVNDSGEQLASPEGAAKGTTLDLVAPKVTIQDVTFTSVTVDWSGIGSDAEKFTVNLTNNDGRNQRAHSVITIGGDERSVNFTGLTPENSYTATVIGFVRDGEMDLASPEGKANATTLKIVAPDVMISETTFTTATVTWSGIGAIATKFTIHLTTDDLLDEVEEKDAVTDGDEHSILFTGLQPGVSYIATVVGYVQDGERELASPKGINEGTTKTPPLPKVEVTNSGLSTMDIIWTISSPAPNKFEVEFFPTEKPNQAQSIVSEDSSIRLKDLTPATEYTIQVKAIYFDGGDEVKSKVGYTTGTTKKLHAPIVTVVNTTYTAGQIEWTGVGMAVDRWEIRSESIDGTGPGEIREQEAMQPAEEQLADLYDLSALNKAEVIGVVIEDGKEFRSPVGSTVITIDPVPPPTVTVDNTTQTTLDAVWEQDIVPDNFVLQIYETLPFENLEGYLKHQPGKEAILTNGNASSHQFVDLTPGTEYIVAVWAKIVEETNEVLSLTGLANGATKPMPPENLLLDQNSPISLEVSFDPPNQGSATSFEILCLSEDSEPSEVEVIEIENELDKNTSSKVSSCENLSPGQLYEVRVRSVLQSGDELFSDLDPILYNMNKQRFGPYYSEYVMASDTIKVGPVQGFSLVEPTAHSILAVWQPPQHTELVDYYVLSYKPVTSEKQPVQLQIQGDRTSKLLTFLHPDTPYEATIEPIVNSVRGPKIDDVKSTLKDIVSLQFVNSSFTTISVEWPVSQVPEVSYVLSWLPREEESASGEEPTPLQPLVVAAGHSSMVIESLAPATLYDITIEYVYQTEPYGTASTDGSTGLPPPGPITFTDVQETSFVAHWEKPDYGAQPIGYHVTYIGPDGASVTVNVPGAGTLSLEIENVLAGTFYNVSVVADYGQLSDSVKAQVDTKMPVCNCASYTKNQQLMMKAVEKLLNEMKQLTSKVASLEFALKGRDS